MNKVPSAIHFSEYSSEEELPKEDLELLRSAKSAARQSYAPYSNYHVGAAVRLGNGKVITGNNQENAAYPSGLCAERVALYHAQSVYPDVPVDTIAITAYTSKFTINEPVPPCGSCRQVMAEYEDRHNHPMRVIMSGETGRVVVSDDMNSLLPLKFNAKQLRK